MTTPEVFTKLGKWAECLVMHMEKFAGPDGLIRPLDLDAAMIDRILRTNVGDPSAPMLSVAEFVARLREKK